MRQPVKSCGAILVSLWRVSTDAVLHASGLPAFFYLSFHATVLQFVFFLALGGGLVLWPLHASHAPQSSSATGFPDWSSASLRQGSPWFWVHFALFVLECVGFHYFLIGRLVCLLQTTRASFLLRSGFFRSVQSRTLMLRHLSQSLRDPEPLVRWLQKISAPPCCSDSNMIERCHLVLDLPKLSRLKKQWVEWTEALLSCYPLHLGHHPPSVSVGGTHRRTLRVATGCCSRFSFGEPELVRHTLGSACWASCWGCRTKPRSPLLVRSSSSWWWWGKCCPCWKRVDAREWTGARVHKLETQIEKELNKENHPSCGVAFVTFSSSVLARRCFQNLSFRGQMMLPTTPNRDPQKPSTVDLDDGFSSVELELSSVDEETVSNGSPYQAATDDWVERFETKQKGGADDIPVGAHKREINLHAEPTTEEPSTDMVASLAPESEDIIWDNLSASVAKREVARVLGGMAQCILVLFWTVPVAFFGSLGNLVSLPIVGPLFAKIMRLPEGQLGLITAYLPALVLLLFNSLLPSLLRRLILAQKPLLWSTVNRRLMDAFFVFTFFSTVVLPSAVIGSVKLVAMSLVLQPLDTLLTLLTQITAPQSSLFIAFLIQEACIGSCTTLLRFGDLVLFLTHKTLTLRPTAPETTLSPHFFRFEFWEAYGSLLLMLTVTLFFSLTMPLTSLFGLLFFACRYVVVRLQLIHVYVPLRAQCEDNLFPAAIRHLFLIQILFQLATAGMFAGNQCALPFILSLLSLTWTFVKYKHTCATLRATLKHDAWIAPQSERDDRMLVEQKQSPHMAAVQSQEDPFLYIHPALRPD